MRRAPSTLLLFVIITSSRPLLAADGGTPPRTRVIHRVVSRPRDEVL